MTYLLIILSAVYLGLIYEGMRVIDDEELHS